MFDSACDGYWLESRLVRPVEQRWPNWRMLRLVLNWRMLRLVLNWRMLRLVLNWNFFLFFLGVGWAQAQPVGGVYGGRWI
jgi:hypothetical protein